MTPVDLREGDSPVVLGMPHTGTYVPPDIAARLNDTGRALADTDWHIDQLYDGLLPGATTVRATFHRYVIDANRDPEGQSLYPGQNTTGLCPVTDFDGQDIYHIGEAPQADEIADRLATFHTPYHSALEAQMQRICDRHGFAILYECHSIRSQIPYLFEGQLPDLNIGTNLSTTCDPQIELCVEGHARAVSHLSTMVNGRFKGGWTTRHYGRPETGWHAIQMEIAQRAYLTEEAAPWTFDTSKADRLRPALRAILTDLARWRPQ